MDIEHSQARVRQQRLAQRLSFLEEELLALQADSGRSPEKKESISEHE